MNCLAVRERLPEHALSVLDARDEAAVERHLRWCAGCRKEAAELEEAAAAFGFALAPVPIPEGLGDRVVGRLREAADAPGRKGRARSAVASAVAAMVAVAGLGWGAVMAGRADRFRERAVHAQHEQTKSLELFRKLLAQVPGRSPQDVTRFGRLAPTPGRRGGGAALVLVSPSILDLAMVIVNGLDPKDAALPFRVSLENGEGATLGVGKVTSLDADGGAQVFNQFTRDLSSFTRVVVKDATGVVVLQGTVGPSSLLTGP